MKAWRHGSAVLSPAQFAPAGEWTVRRHGDTRPICWHLVGCSLSICRCTRPTWFLGNHGSSVTWLAGARSGSSARLSTHAVGPLCIGRCVARAVFLSSRASMQHAASALHNTAGPVAQTAGLGNCPQHTCSTRLARPRRRAAPLPNARSTRQGFRPLMALQMPLRSARFKVFK